MIHVPEYIKGLIFDCDGTLVDSMPLHMEAWEHAIHRSGEKYDREFFFSKKGMRETEIIELYNACFNTTLNRNDVVAAKHQFFRKHIIRVKPVRPVVDIVHRYTAGLPMAVVSGGVREFVEEELRVIGISRNFEVILTADDPFKPKPAPDLFLEAARRMNVQPSLCQVFEDGEIGIQAATNAGMLATDVRPFIEQ